MGDIVDNYGTQIKSLRIQMGLTQNQVAKAMGVTPGYISNVENGRTAMSLRMLVYYSKVMNISLDSLVGRLEPEYESTAIDRDLMREISKMTKEDKVKLLKTIQVWNE